MYGDIITGGIPNSIKQIDETLQLLWNLGHRAFPGALPGPWMDLTIKNAYNALNAVRSKILKHSLGNI